MTYAISLFIAIATLAASLTVAKAETRAASFKLENGLELVVVPDNRAPVVTHVIAYRVGALDDPPGFSGLAHFLEHLMYKSTTTMPSGSFARTVSRLGGNENAVTSHDATIFHQRVPKEGLARVMALEADRMRNLRFDPLEIEREHNVVIEERRQRIDLSPINRLNELMTARLFGNRAYGIPVLGWPQEIPRLTADQSELFYNHHYRPSNAIVVVMGDVTTDLALRLAREAYGAIPASRESEASLRPALPPSSGGFVDLADSQVTNRSLFRTMFALLPAMSNKGDAEALELLVRIVAQGETSRLHKRLVERDKAALRVEGGTSIAQGGLRLAIYAVARPNVALGTIEAAFDEEIDNVRDNGVSEDELEGARSIIATADLFERDKQSTLALRYAEGLARGESIEQIEQRPARLAAVTAADVQRVALTHMTRSKAVTGALLPAAVKGAAQ